MKKLLLNFIVSSFFIFIPINVLATSGACSYHGGVNCSAGQDYDGSVTCNDGTRDSSVAYGDMSMCNLSLSDLCPSPIIMGPTTMLLCDDIQKRCDSYNAARTNALIQSGAAQYASVSSQIDTSCPEAVSCREQVAISNKQLELHKECVADTLKNLETQRLNASKQALNKQCQDKLGVGAYSFDYSGKCVCPTGKYIGSSGKCVTEQEEYNTYNFLCKYLYGQNSHASSTSLSTHDCDCDLGYIIDKTGKCSKVEDVIVKKQSITSITTKIENEPKKAGLLNRLIIKTTTDIKNTSHVESVKTSTTTLVTATATQLQEPVKAVKWYKKVFWWFK